MYITCFHFGLKYMQDACVVAKVHGLALDVHTLSWVEGNCNRRFLGFGQPYAVHCSGQLMRHMVQDRTALNCHPRMVTAR